MTTAAEFTKRWKATPAGQASTLRYESSEKGRAARRRAKRAWKARNRDVAREHTRIMGRVRYHVLVGHITKTACVVCGSERVQAHHHNGYAPEHELDVIWLCSRHHADVHRDTTTAGIRQHTHAGVAA